jgi:membrane protease YdiL (CAAX protease family)
MDTTVAGTRTPWGVGDIALAMGMVVAGAIFLAVPLGTAATLVAAQGQVDQDPLATALLLGASMGVELLLLAAAIVLSVGKYGAPPALLGWRWSWRGSLWTALAALLGAYLVLGIYTGAVQALGLEGALPQEQVPEVAFREPPLTALTAITVLALAPIAEETFFRGFVFGGLRGRWGVVLAALASGLLFSAVHFQPQVVVPFAGIGIVFALTYAYCGSIVPGVLAHLAFNGISFGLALAGAG